MNTLDFGADTACITRVFTNKEWTKKIKSQHFYSYDVSNSKYAKTVF